MHGRMRRQDRINKLAQQLLFASIRSWTHERKARHAQQHGYVEWECDFITHNDT